MPRAPSSHRTSAHAVSRLPPSAWSNQQEGHFSWDDIPWPRPRQSRLGPQVSAFPAQCVFSYSAFPGRDSCCSSVSQSRLLSSPADTTKAGKMFPTFLLRPQPLAKASHMRSSQHVFVEWMNEATGASKSADPWLLATVSGLFILLTLRSSCSRLEVSSAGWRASRKETNESFSERPWLRSKEGRSALRTGLTIELWCVDPFDGWSSWPPCPIH